MDNDPGSRRFGAHDFANIARTNVDLSGARNLRNRISASPATTLNRAIVRRVTGTLQRVIDGDVQMRRSVYCWHTSHESEFVFRDIAERGAIDQTSRRRGAPIGPV